MKMSLENMKKKVSEVLKLFKQELENKINKKHQLQKQYSCVESNQNLSEMLLMAHEESLIN